MHLPSSLIFITFSSIFFIISFRASQVLLWLLCCGVSFYFICCCMCGVEDRVLSWLCILLSVSMVTFMVTLLLLWIFLFSFRSSFFLYLYFSFDVLICLLSCVMGSVVYSLCLQCSLIECMITSVVLLSFLCEVYVFYVWRALL